MLERIGCGIWLALFLGLPLFGWVTAIKNRSAGGLGVLWGVTTWLALVSGYMTVLSIIDLRRRRTIPPENDVPRWVIPTAWCVFILSATASVLLLRRL